MGGRGKRGNDQEDASGLFEETRPRTFETSDTVIENYKIAQEGKDNKNPKKLEENQLVFFTCDNEEKFVTSIGPVRMHKDVYRYSTGHFLKQLGKDVTGDEDTFTPCDDPDRVCPVCQLFGFIPEQKDKSEQGIAGRIFISTAKLISAVPESVPVPLRILGGPKPKYYPFYLTGEKGKIHQGFDNDRPNGRYSWESDLARMPGRKFYWHHPNFVNQPENKDYLSHHPGENGEKIEEPRTDQNITARALPAACEFRFAVRFENLSSEELGLLLFAIDFNDKADGNHCHHVGMGKSLGMGTVMLRIDAVKLTDRKERYSSLQKSGELERDETLKCLERAREEFANTMSAKNGGGSFEEIPNIRDMLRITDITNPSESSDVRYRPLNLRPDENYAWFGGGTVRRDGWSRGRKYIRPHQKLPSVAEVVENNVRVGQGEWD